MTTAAQTTTYRTRNSEHPERLALYMTTLGLIGSGNIGKVVARLAILADYDVVLSNSRGPDTLSDVIAELGPKARAATAEEAAAAGDIVVATIPLKAYEQIPVAPLEGKIVIDTLNYYPERDGQFPSLDDGTATTSGLVQEHLAGSHVVKGFNNIFFVALDALARPRGEGDRSTLPIFGDNLAAKTGAAEFLDTLGYDSLDGGSLSDSWRAENGRPVYVHPYATGDDVNDPSPADGPTIRRLLDEADRSTSPAAAGPPS